MKNRVKGYFASTMDETTESPTRYFDSLKSQGFLGWEHEYWNKNEKHMTTQQLAQLCHEANRAYCEMIGDLSQDKWDDAPEWQKESATNGIKFLLENPDSTPEEIHNNWMKDKRKAGWIWGEIKDPERLEHPCLRPYHELPKQQQVKDKLFKSLVDAFRQDILPFE